MTVFEMLHFSAWICAAAPVLPGRWLFPVRAAVNDHHTAPPGNNPAALDGEAVFPARLPAVLWLQSPAELSLAAHSDGYQHR